MFLEGVRSECACYWLLLLLRHLPLVKEARRKSLVPEARAKCRRIRVYRTAPCDGVNTCRVRLHLRTMD